MILVPSFSLEVVQTPFPLRWHGWHLSIFELSHLEQIREPLSDLIRVPLVVSYKVSYLIFPSEINHLRRLAVLRKPYPLPTSAIWPFVTRIAIDILHWSTSVPLELPCCRFCDCRCCSRDGLRIVQR